MKQNITLDETAIKTVECILNDGDRAEVMPAKDGIKIFRMRREFVKTDRKEERSKC